MAKPLVILGKLLVCASIIVGACVAIQNVALEPYFCNRIKKSTEMQTLLAFDLPDGQAAAIRARRNLEALSRCTASGDIDLYMLRAANYRLLGRTAEAAAQYSMALRYDERPEIYFNLGITQLQMGRRGDAVRSFTTAVRFNPYIIGEITDPTVWSEVHKQVWGE